MPKKKPKTAIAKTKTKPKTEAEQAALVLSEKNKGAIVSSIVLQGDLSRLTSDQKVDYYNRFCYSLGLNPLTMPFNLLKLSNKEVLYANKNCAEQLRKNNGVSILDINQQIINGILVVNVKGQDKAGRTDVETGAVSVAGLSGDALANATMKAVTKAKRRLTLSICSVGVLDESELETIPDAEKIPLPTITGGAPAQTTPSTSAEVQQPTGKQAPAAQPKAMPGTHTPTLEQEARLTELMDGLGLNDRQRSLRVQKAAALGYDKVIAELEAQSKPAAGK